MMLIAVQVFESERLPEFLLGIGLDLVAISLIAVLTYRRSNARAQYVFSLIAMNIVVFFATYLMSVASVSVNVGFGLFALFGILRFRTSTVPVLEMTYLFAGIALAAFNALAFVSLTVVEAVIANVVVIVVLELVGGFWLSKQASSHSITYERIELVHPARRNDLIRDLELRTGLSINEVVVHDINFLNDTARLTIRAHPQPVGAGLTHARSDSVTAD